MIAKRRPRLIVAVLASAAVVAPGGSESAEEPYPVVSILNDTGSAFVPGTWRIEIFGEGGGRVLADGPERRPRIAKADVDAILRYARSVGYTRLRQQYGFNCVDCPACWIEIVSDGVAKEVQFAPPDGGRWTNASSAAELRDLSVLRSIWQQVKAVAGMKAARDVCGFPDTINTP